MRNENRWVDWNGGECPFGDGTKVDIKLRTGDVIKNETCGRDYAQNKYWKDDFLPCDIVAYRLSGGEVFSKVKDFNKSPESKTMIEESTCNCDGCTDGDDYWDVVKLISEVTPDLAVKYVRLIATKLIDYGYGKIK